MCVMSHIQIIVVTMKLAFRYPFNNSILITKRIWHFQPNFNFQKQFCKVLQFSEFTIYPY